MGRRRGNTQYCESALTYSTPIQGNTMLKWREENYLVGNIPDTILIRRVQSTAGISCCNVKPTGHLKPGTVEW